MHVQLRGCSSAQGRGVRSRRYEPCAYKRDFQPLVRDARSFVCPSLGKQHIKGDWLQYVPKKTLYKRRTASQKPLLPVLREIIDTSRCGAMTFLQTEYGK